MVKGNIIKRGDVYWVNLDPATGTETKKTRPAVIISNDAQNRVGRRYIIAPITSVVKTIYPFEAEIQIDNTPSKVMLDQIRTVDDQRLGQKLCTLSIEELSQIEKVLKLVLSIV